MAVKVLLADDSEIVRRGMRQLLATQPEIEIAGESSDFALTIQMTRDLNPQLVILDLHLTDESKVPPQDVKSQLNPGVRVLAISFWNDEKAKELAESLGTAVLLDKIDLAHLLIPAIMQLSSGSRRVTCRRPVWTGCRSRRFCVCWFRRHCTPGENDVANGAYLQTRDSIRIREQSTR